MRTSCPPEGWAYRLGWAEQWRYENDGGGAGVRAVHDVMVVIFLSMTEKFSVNDFPRLYCSPINVKALRVVHFMPAISSVECKKKSDQLFNASNSAASPHPICRHPHVLEDLEPVPSNRMTPQSHGTSISRGEPCLCTDYPFFLGGGEQPPCLFVAWVSHFYGRNVQC